MPFMAFFILALIIPVVCLAESAPQNWYFEDWKYFQFTGPDVWDEDIMGRRADPDGSAFRATADSPQVTGQKKFHSGSLVKKRRGRLYKPDHPDRFGDAGE
jgi:hypothetical protein